MHLPSASSRFDCRLVQCPATLRRRRMNDGGAPLKIRVNPSSKFGQFPSGTGTVACSAFVRAGERACQETILRRCLSWSFLRLLRCGITLAVLLGMQLQADEPNNINDLKSDLSVPAVTEEKGIAGKRFLMTLPEYQGGSLAHVVYLPSDWKPGNKYPVIVEYPGNGGYENAYGDRSTGRVEDCKLGYGISGGTGFIWVCLPFVDLTTKSHSLLWWGDPDATAAYCRAAVAQVCNEYGGDPESLVLTGFSRGALACGYIGLRDDQTAKLWRAIIAHSHFDGVRLWDYAESDQESARRRLLRYGARPLYVTQERSVDAIQTYLRGTDSQATVRVLPYPNHTDEWVLKDVKERQELRLWLSRVLSQSVVSGK